MRNWRVGKIASKLVKVASENPEALDKIASTGRKVWKNPTVQAKRASLLKRLKGRFKTKPDKN